MVCLLLKKFPVKVEECNWEHLLQRSPTLPVVFRLLFGVAHPLAGRNWNLVRLM